jgi:hypothetical protein
VLRERVRRERGESGEMTRGCSGRWRRQRSEAGGGNDRGREEVDDNYQQVRSDTGMDGEM